MDEQLKQRLVGALVLLSAAVIFLPLIFDGRDEQAAYSDVQIPEEPVVTLDVSKPEIDTEYYDSVQKKVEDERAAVAPSEESLNQPVTTVVEPEPAEKAVKQDFEAIKKAAESPATGTDRLAENYTVQLAAFSTRENAEKLHKRLIEKDYKAYIQKGKSGSNTVYRVFVGPQLRKNRAEIIAEALHKEFQLKGMVVRYAP